MRLIIMWFEATRAGIWQSGFGAPWPRLQFGSVHYHRGRRESWGHTGCIDFRLVRGRLFWCLWTMALSKRTKCVISKSWIYFFVDRKLFGSQKIHPKQEYLRVIHTGRQHDVQHGIYCHIGEINLTHWGIYASKFFFNYWLVWSIGWKRQ